MKVVLDTNVLVSTFISRQIVPARVVALFQNDDHTLLLSDAVFTELRRVLDYPHLRRQTSYTDDQIAAFLRGLQAIAAWVEPVERLAVSVEDETNNHFLELAVDGGARYIVSGDKHLRKVRRYQAIEIVSPAEFLAFIKVE